MNTALLIIAFLLGFVFGGFTVIVLALTVTGKENQNKINSEAIDRMAKEYIADAERIDE